MLVLVSGCQFVLVLVFIGGGNVVFMLLQLQVFLLLLVVVVCVQIGVIICYDFVYQVLFYFGGDVLFDCGVCIDVVVCVLCSQGLDLQVCLYEDMCGNFSVYLVIWGLL